MKQLFKDSIVIFLKGLAMGAVDAVPGVSGGTIAFITGIYSRLVSGINDVRKEIQNTIFAPKQIIQNVKKLDWPFFIPLGLGIAIALFIFSGIMSFFLENFTANTFAFFAGLIAASAILFVKKLDWVNFQNMLALVLGFIFAFIISEITATKIPHTFPIIFASGMIAICAMILPGISGSFLLVLLGQYEYVISAIHEKNLFVISIFGAGAALGILSFSKLLNFLLERYHNLTLYSLTGLMLGALRVPYLEIQAASGFQNPIYLLYFIVLGAGIVFGIERLAKMFSD